MKKKNIKKQNSSNAKKKYIQGGIVLGIFLLIFGLSYAFFTIVLNGTKKVKITTATMLLRMVDKDGNDIYTLDDSYSENSSYAINLENQVPISDAEGLSQEGFTFSVINEGTIPTNYKLTIVDDIENTLGDSNIKYSLEEKDYYDKDSDVFQGITRNLKPVGTINYQRPGVYGRTHNFGYKTLDTLDNRVLDEMTILPNEKIEYVLNIWVDESTGNEAMNKNFEAHIRLDGSQTKPIYSGSAGDTVDYDYYPDGTLIFSGTGKMSNVVIDLNNDNFTEISNNGTAFTDITYKVLKDKGFDFEEVTVDNYNNYELTAGNATFFLTDYFEVCTEDEILGNTYAFCDEDLRNVQEDYGIEKTAQVYNALKDYRLNRVVVYEGITSISGVALSDIGNKMVSLPTSLTSLTEGALLSTMLMDIVIPENVSEITSIDRNNPTIDMSWWAEEAGDYTNRIYVYNTKEYVDNNWDPYWYNESYRDRNEVIYLK